MGKYTVNRGVTYFLSDLDGRKGVKGDKTYEVGILDNPSSNKEKEISITGEGAEEITMPMGHLPAFIEMLQDFLKLYENIY